ncbi:MAG: hypothetical protein BWX70_03089 [Verrucomicrobia bacterium ADurb.Bin070]|nr:MAG: hypothetical protein BWX70_03089 [Verrucomicrobia bacterium ADurb.Bin070]
MFRHVLPSSFESAVLSGTRRALRLAGMAAWSFQTSSRSPVEGRRLIEAGETGDRIAEATGGVHVSPPSDEYARYWHPPLARMNIITRPSFSSTTPGSCVVMRTPAASYPFCAVALRRHVTPLSSDR